MINNFKEIFSRYDTDKVNGSYEYAYEECFGNARDDIQLIFEIGVNRGGSMRAWKEYFPNSKIVGLEIHGHCYFEEERIHIEIGDATKSQFINAVLDKYGWPDIVIDDGSHFSRDMKASFSLLYPFAQIGYVIEDLGTQTFNYKNGFYINDDEPATSIVFQEVGDLLFGLAPCKSIRVYRGISIFLK